MDSGAYEMKTYKVMFYGRTAGALGVCYWIEDIIEAPNMESIRLALYDKYEHITNLSAEEI